MSWQHRRSYHIRTDTDLCTDGNFIYKTASLGDHKQTKQTSGNRTTDLSDARPALYWFGHRALWMALWQPLSTCYSLSQHVTQWTCLETYYNNTPFPNSLYRRTCVKPRPHYCECVSICMMLAFVYGIKSVQFKLRVSSHAYVCMTVAICVCVTFRSAHVAIENVNVSHMHPIRIVRPSWWCQQPSKI